MNLTNGCHEEWSEALSWRSCKKHKSCSLISERCMTGKRQQSIGIVDWKLARMIASKVLLEAAV
jgi:hypothetical protein